MIPILQKILKELDEEVPDTSYIRGMLEVLIETNNPYKEAAARPVAGALNPPYNYTTTIDVPVPIPSSLAEIKRMAGEI